MTEIVLVSGGSGGIGSALCRQLAAAGYRPIIGYSRSYDAAVALAAETNGTTIQLDLTNIDSIVNATTILAGLEGNLAGVVLAASPPPAIGPFFRLPQDEMDVQWSVHVVGASMLLNSCIRQLMRPRRSGWVLAVLSAAMGREGPAAKNMGGYIIAKHGLLGLTKVIEAEYGWLDVYTIEPSFTETPMLKVFDERFLNQMRAQQQNNRFATPDEVARDAIARISSVK